MAKQQARRNPAAGPMSRHENARQAEPGEQKSKAILMPSHLIKYLFPFTTNKAIVIAPYALILNFNYIKFTTIQTIIFIYKQTR